MRKTFLIVMLTMILVVFFGCKPNHEHDYKETKVEPSCTEQGYIEFKCECGDSYKDNFVKAKGHLFGEWVVVKEATVTEEGQKMRTCECEEKETEKIDKLSNNHTHSFGEWVVVKEATESEEGLKEKVCSCGEKETEPIEKLEHSHVYINGYCNCGEKHNCNYVDHKCICGYNEKRYEVKLSVDNEIIETISIYESETLDELTTPNKEDYEFIGWFFDPDFNELFNNNILIKENLTLYAKFKKQYVTISYPNLDKTLFPTTKVKVGSKYVLPEAPEKDGYEYIGWYYDNNLINKIEEDSFEVLEDDYTIYPGYRKYLTIKSISAEVVEENMIALGSVDKTDSNRIRRLSKVEGSDSIKTTPKNYSIMRLSDSLLKVTVNIDNNKEEAIEAIKITCDDEKAMVLVDGEYVSLNNDSFVVEYSTNTNQVILYLQVPSIKEIITFTVKDIKVNGKWQEYAIDNNELLIFKITHGCFEWNYYKANDEYFLLITLPGDCETNLKLNDNKISKQYHDVNGESIRCYKIPESGTIEYKCKFTVDKYIIIWEETREINLDELV